ncbi:MAG TPA: hypothetical protein VFK37_00405 [Bacillales bacterium]|nr:hypothetical protein [Bacillales bacterium]
MTRSKKIEQAKSSMMPMMWILIFLGYEWLVSGINKIASGEFVTGLHGEMMEAIKEGAPYAVYSDFLKSVCLAHCEILAVLIEAGEIFAGATFLFIGIVGLVKGNLSSWLVKIGIASSIVSAILSINIFFYVGGAYFFGQADPFDEGIPIDLLLFLMELAAIGYFFSLNRLKVTDNRTALN